MQTKIKSTDRNPGNDEVNIVIPGFIAHREGLSLIEKIALAAIHKNPRISNATLAKRLELSVRGVENLLARLKENDAICQIGSGCARRLRINDVEHHTKCDDLSASNKHTECGSLAPVRGMTLEDFMAYREMAATVSPVGISKPPSSAWPLFGKAQRTILL
jgi:hypothetical protein